MHRLPRRLRAISALLTVLCLLLTGSACDDDGQARGRKPELGESGPPPQAPTTPEEVRVAFGEPATFTLAAGAREPSRAELTVTSVEEGSMRDLADFKVPPEHRDSTPYYVHATVRNVGSGDLAGAHVALWALDSTGTVLPATDFTGYFGKCARVALPKRFTRDEKVKTCLTFLAPKGVTLEAIQYRFADNTPPYSWPAEVATPR